MSDLLFDIPASKPPVKPWQRVKEKFGILTDFNEKSPDPWMALLPFDYDKDKPFMECIREDGWLDYKVAGRCRGGETEEDAVLTLCEQMSLPIKLSDLTP